MNHLAWATGMTGSYTAPPSSPDDMPNGVMHAKQWHSRLSTVFLADGEFEGPGLSATRPSDCLQSRRGGLIVRTAGTRFGWGSLRNYREGEVFRTPLPCRSEVGGRKAT